MENIPTDIDSDHGSIIFHYDVPNHCIPSHQFKHAIETTERIVNTFNTNLFDDQIKLKLYVRAPKKGSLLAEIILWVGGVGSAAWIALESDMGRSFIKGLTMHEPSHWTKKAGTALRNKMLAKSQSPLNEQAEVQQLQNITVRMVLAEATVGFLTKDAEELTKIGVSKSPFRLAYQAKNRFWRDCLNNKDLSGIGFDRKEAFEYRRADFPRFITKLPKPADDKKSNNEHLIVETVDLSVHSPTWKQDGRKWQADTNAHKDVTFDMEDGGFWRHVEIRDIKPSIKDSLRVQWVYEDTKGKPTNAKVLRVLTYNGKELSKPLSQNQLAELLFDFRLEEHMDDLFANNTKEPE